MNTQVNKIATFNDFRRLLVPRSPVKMKVVGGTTVKLIDGVNRLIPFLNVKLTSYRFHASEIILFSTGITPNEERSPEAYREMLLLGGHLVEEGEYTPEMIDKLYSLEL